ncbi:hypothetical protein H9N25_03515 [Pedobacter riviphilus]|uniref:Uncharacterized protein n=1 Tax=Pedobacter riviphilus TaxID=2766984 RepID=A0ABX6TKV8_9SPHI|nr:hypothetical protein [Pedobacter riviphilus]QNR85556.1 hypothetical protein H9N25_03515 [Pedobacter riviphilus]
MKKLFNFAAMLLLLGVVSCKKENAPIENEQNFSFSEKTSSEVSFAKILAKAVKSDESLRNFIKTESLKQFDKDHDILYQLVKNREISDGKTLREKLLGFTTAEELDKIESKLPLLTIFVPTLPGFSPEAWNQVSEIPLIAVSNTDAKNSIGLYGDGDEAKLRPTEIPGFPVIVIKQNERVRVKTDINKVASNSRSLNFNTGSTISFEFIDQAFDGSIPDVKNTSSQLLNSNKFAGVKGTVSRVAPSPNLSNPNAIDQVNVDAYNSGSEWHRDYVYYGITPSSPNGKFRNYYSEFITSFKFLTPNALGLIADQDGDPKPFPNYIDGNIPLNENGHRTPGWFDGNFEFRITVLINSKNGVGNEYVRQISVNPRDLFDLQYKFLGEVKMLFFKGNAYELETVIPKEYHPNVELIPWDLENYGTAWKFIFYEVDGTQEETKSYENTTTFAANFEVNGGVKDKIGAKFGLAATSSEKRTYSVKTMLGSDYLGEAILTFDQPIIIATSNGSYATREITNGNVLSISVEPRRNNIPIN